MQPSPDAIRCVQELAGEALRLEVAGSAGSASPEPHAHLARVSAVDLAAASVRHRVTDLLHAQVGGLGLEARFGPGLVDWLAAAHAESRRGVTVQLLELRRVLDAFAARGLRVLVFKGPVLAVQSAGCAWARGAGDIDLFIAPESIEQASSILEERGWHPRLFGSATPGTWASRHLVRTFNEMTFDGRASTIDLHWRLDPSDDALPGFEESWERRAVIDVGGLGVPSLDAADALVHTCLHAAKDDWRWLRSVVDVHRLARSPGIWTEVERLGSRPTWRSLAVTEHLLGLPEGVPPAIRRRIADHRGVVRRACRMQERAARADSPFPAAQSARDLRHRLAASRSPRAVALAVAAAVIPAPSLARTQDRTAWTAVPRLVLSRCRWLVLRCVHWTTGRTRDQRRADAARTGAPEHPLRMSPTRNARDRS